jgi:hypothetical protein
MKIDDSVDLNRIAAREAGERLVAVIPETEIARFRGPQQRRAVNIASCSVRLCAQQSKNPKRPE